MHCNLRPPDVAPVVLDFITMPIEMHQYLKVQQIRQCMPELLMSIKQFFLPVFFQKAILIRLVLKSWMNRITLNLRITRVCKNGGRISDFSPM